MCRAGFDPAQPTAWVVELLPADPAALFADICDLSAPGSRLAAEFPETGTAHVDRLTERGWETTGLPAATLLDRYGRCHPEEDPESAPRSVFVEGHCPVAAGELAS